MSSGYVAFIRLRDVQYTMCSRSLMPVRRRSRFRRRNSSLENLNEILANDGLSDKPKEDRVVKFKDEPDRGRSKSRFGRGKSTSAAPKSSILKGPSKATKTAEKTATGEADATSNKISAVSKKERKKVKTILLPPPAPSPAPPPSVKVIKAAAKEKSCADSDSDAVVARETSEEGVTATAVPPLASSSSSSSSSSATQQEESRLRLRPDAPQRQPVLRERLALVQSQQ